MRQPDKAHLARAGRHAGEGDAKHAPPERGGVCDELHAEEGEGDDGGDAEVVGHAVDGVGEEELGEEGGQDVEEEDEGFGEGRADEVEGGGEDDDVEDVVYEPWGGLVMVRMVWGAMGGRTEQPEGETDPPVCACDEGFEAGFEELHCRRGEGEGEGERGGHDLLLMGCSVV